MCVTVYCLLSYVSYYIANYSVCCVYAVSQYERLAVAEYYIIIYKKQKMNHVYITMYM